MKSTLNGRDESRYRLYLVTDDRLSQPELVRIVGEAVAGGVSLVQLREKQSDIRAFIRKAEAIKKVLAGTGVQLLINDRVDVALAADADGVHLGQSDMPVTLARKLLGPEKLIGLSIENEVQLLEAESLPVDYLGLSAVFATSTKQDIKNQWGLAGLKMAVQTSTLPVVAIGGINTENLSAVIQTGCAGVALVSALCAAVSPRLAAQQLLSQIESVLSEVIAN